LRISEALDGRTNRETDRRTDGRSHNKYSDPQIDVRRNRRHYKNWIDAVVQQPN